MLKLNKVFIIILSIIVTMFIVFLFLLQFNNKDAIKIGIVGHFSGEYASYGVPMENAIKLAFKERDVNGKKYDLIFEDDMTKSSEAVAVINKLIDVDGVNYILSAQGSGVTSSIVPLVQNKGKILMITLASAPNLTKDKKYIFRSVSSDIYQGVKMVSYINNVLKSKKVAGLYINDPYGVGIKEIIENNTKSVMGELFVSGVKDFRTSLLKIKSVNPDTLVLVARENEYPQMLKQIKELGIKSNIIASETFKSENVLNNSRGYDEGVVTFIMNSSDNKVFDSKYKKMFNVNPSAYSMYAYDGAVALIDAIKKGNNNLEKVRDYLAKTKFEGVSGEVSFDSEGDRMGIKYFVYKVIGGEFVKQ